MSGAGAWSKVLMQMIKGTLFVGFEARVCHGDPTNWASLVESNGVERGPVRSLHLSCFIILGSMGKRLGSQRASSRFLPEGVHVGTYTVTPQKAQV